MNAFNKYFPENIKLYEDKIIVYLVQLSLFKTDEFLPILSEDEVSRANKLKIDSKKKQFIITRGVLRSLVSACLINTKPEEIHFSYGDHGKPSIENRFYNKPIKLNVSHSGGYALIALTLNHEVGVDIEKIDSSIDYQSLAMRFFSKDEIGKLKTYESSQKLDAFYCCWVRKEAFIKGEGSGVSFGLDRFSVSLDKEEKCSEIKIEKTISSKERWFNYETVSLPHFKTAIAASKDGLHVVTHVITS